MRDWSDKRPINELRFGVEWKPTIGDLQTQQPGFGAVDAPFGMREGDPPGAEVLLAWNEKHAGALARLLTLFVQCNCKIADDIVNLGCTGALAAGLSIDDIMFLRMGLGGSGVGLPCFVPPDRYCLAHEVTGGLQDGQEQRHTEQVEKISRPLDAKEKAQAELLDHARTAEGTDREAATADVLAGRKLPDGWERDNGVVTRGIEDSKAGRVSPVPLSVLAESVWKCPEHTETKWECRYCVAQAIVEGELVPTYLVEGEDSIAQIHHKEAADIDAHVESNSRSGCEKLDIYVLAARFTLKLSRI